MSREWKPGDVAIRTYGGDYPQQSIVVARCGDDHHDSGPHWHIEPEGWDPIDVDEQFPKVAFRPLVVIDPEDVGEVERLVYAIRDASAVRPSTPATQAALREFANPTPPKPDEPTGLGAVVEDEKGTFWFRMTVENQTWPGEVWQEQYGEADRWSKWADVCAVKVLSDGVQP